MAKTKVETTKKEAVKVEDVAEKEVVPTETKPMENKDNIDIAQLMAMLEQQKKTIDALTKTVESVQTNAPMNTAGVTPQFIVKNEPNKYIKVVSLREGSLTLSTEPFGHGKVKRFTKYGEAKTILESELKQIIDANFSFAEKGYFYICDENFVMENELEEAYHRILSPENIAQILKGASVNDTLALFKRATDEQKLLIIDKIVVKCTHGEYNEEIISKLEKETKVNIREQIANSKRYSQPEAEEDEE